MVTNKINRGGARPGAGRKPTGSTLVAITPRISPVAADWLHKLASNHGSSQAQVIEHLILTAESLPETLHTARK